jgi:hypothetical protein
MTAAVERRERSGKPPPRLRASCAYQSKGGDGQLIGWSYLSTTPCTSIILGQPLTAAAAAVLYNGPSLEPAGGRCWRSAWRVLGATGDRWPDRLRWLTVAAAGPPVLAVRLKSGVRTSRNLHPIDPFSNPRDQRDHAANATNASAGNMIRRVARAVGTIAAAGHACMGKPQFVRRRSRGLFLPFIQGCENVRRGLYYESVASWIDFGGLVWVAWAADLASSVGKETPRQQARAKILACLCQTIVGRSPPRVLACFHPGVMPELHPGCRFPRSF